MPFKSEKQRRYLWANEPELAREWTEKYGSGVQEERAEKKPKRKRKRKKKADE